jgi:hypothetical protein
MSRFWKRWGPTKGTSLPAGGCYSVVVSCWHTTRTASPSSILLEKCHFVIATSAAKADPVSAQSPPQTMLGAASLWQEGPSLAATLSGLYNRIFFGLAVLYGLWGRG